MGMTTTSGLIASLTADDLNNSEKILYIKTIFEDLETRLARLEERVSGIAETNNLWDGS